METPLENCLMTFYKVHMVAFMHAHPECFEEAIALAVSDKQPYAWRAAWLLGDCMQPNDERVKPNIKQITDVVLLKKDGHRRELLKILMKMELDEEQEGMVFDICISMWEKLQFSPSVRYTAFMFLLRIAAKYPELKNEIAFFSQQQYLETLSPGIRNSLQLKVNNFLYETDDTKTNRRKSKKG